MDPTEIFKWINDGCIIGVLVFIVITGSKKLWVFGWQYRDLEEKYRKVEESNVMWMQLALRSVNVTQQIIKPVATDAVEEK